MHCVICNAELTDFEATRRDSVTNVFVDTCNECLRYSSIKTKDRYDLATEDDLEVLNVDLTDIE